jgi:hypothetical protein
VNLRWQLLSSLNTSPCIFMFSVGSEQEMDFAHLELLPPPPCMQTLFDPNHPLHHRFNCQCESGLQLYYRTEQPHYNHSWNVFSVSFLHSPTEGHEAHLPQCVRADRFSPSPIMEVYTIFIFFWLLYSICGNHVFVSVEWFENALKWIVLPLLKSNVCKKKRHSIIHS